MNKSWKNYWNERDTLRAKYREMYKPSYVEYLKVCELALEEYKQAKQLAHIKFICIERPSLWGFKLACNSALAEYNKVCGEAYSKHEEIKFVVECELKEALDKLSL